MKISEISEELYWTAERHKQIIINNIRFQFQPTEDCLPEFYITDLSTGEFLGSDLTPNMFKRHIDNKTLRDYYDSLEEETEL